MSLLLMSQLYTLLDIQSDVNPENQPMTTSNLHKSWHWPRQIPPQARKGRIDEQGLGRPIRTVCLEFGSATSTFEFSDINDIFHRRQTWLPRRSSSALALFSAPMLVTYVCHLQSMHKEKEQEAIGMKTSEDDYSR